MLGNSSFSQKGATPKDPIAGINSFLNKKFGIPLAPKPTVPSLSSSPGPMSVAPSQPKPAQGSSPGLLMSMAPSSGGINQSVKKDIAGNEYHAPKANKNVLAQQQALNRVGAGLVEDGISGPKTRDAIAKYGHLLNNSGGTPPAPTTPPTPTTPPEKPKPPVAGATSENITPSSAARSVYQAGEQTPQEKEAMTKLYGAGQPTDLEKYYIGRVQEAQGMKNAGELGTSAEASMYKDQTPEQLFDSLVNAPDLIGRSQATKGLFDKFANIYGSQATQGLLAANTIAGRGLSAAQSGLLGAGTQAGRAQTGAGTVFQSSLPTYPSYGSQIVDPLTGLPMGGASGSLQDAVNNVVERLTNGTMTYNDAVAALSGYGQGGLNALQQALPPGFNIAQSNTLSGQQGSVNVNYQLAETALNNVETILKDLGALQTTNIPIINRGANWISTQFGLGSEQTRAMTGAVQSLRNAYASLLASVKGGTPTDYSNQAAAEIPNEPTPNDIAAIRHNFEVLGQARKDILGNPGQAGNPSGGSSGGFGWDALNY